MVCTVGDDMKNKKLNSHKSKLAKGIILTEVLISSVIFIVVTSIAINVYIAVKQHYQANKDKLDNEVKELAVKNIFYNTIKNIGFGCNYGTGHQDQSDVTGDSLDDFHLDPDTLRIGNLPLASSLGYPSELKSGCSTNCYQTNTDYLMIKRESTHTNLINNANNNVLKLGSVDSFATGDYLLLCSADNVNIAKIAGLNESANSVNLSLAPVGVYYSGDYVGKYSLEMLYVADTGDLDSDGDKIYGLYIYIKDSSTDGQVYELIRGVENLKIEYTIASDGAWSTLLDTRDIDSSYRALRMSFDINNNSYSKIVVL